MPKKFHRTYFNKIKILKAKDISAAVKTHKGRIVISVVCIVASSIFILNLRSFILASEHFVVKEIEIIDKKKNNIDYPLNRIGNALNIFKVNLNKISRNLEYEYPDIQKAIVKRILPNKLIIEVLRRRPVAQIRVEGERKGQEERYFLLNENGYVLADLGPFSEEFIPVVVGQNIKLNDIEIGRPCQNSSLKLALSFLRETKKTRLEEKCIITKIDASVPRCLSFYLDNKLEVRISERDWPQKIERLLGMLPNLDMEYSQDYYIDLRFKDFVFGKKQL
ncbi:MAG: cell division protein FtsQ/DivIB [Candidatus Omnitrophica bacterium]|nr:cell division protein FtsQ/DivIB [Candidatus Omnitrophota bacterium]MBU1924660.1 cell division protein FtsQ/DivIB [Candidatus Omnitrophota bacterium]